MLARRFGQFYSQGEPLSFWLPVSLLVALASITLVNLKRQVEKLMPEFIKNILVVALGLLIGGVANFVLVLIGAAVIPAPDGVDTTSTESLAQSMHLLSSKHFAFPFLAHALGTFAGAYVAFRYAASRPKVLAYIVGVMFLAGGIAASSMVPAPTWFIAVDLILAYIPMAWLATRVAPNSSASGLIEESRLG